MDRVIFHVDANSAFLSWTAAYRIKVLGDSVDLREIPAVIAGDKILVEGRNIIVRDNNPEMWDNGLLVGTIGADGKIDELKPVEVVE